MTDSEQQGAARGADDRTGRESGIAEWGWAKWTLVLLAAATVLGLITVLEAHARAITYGEEPPPLITALKGWMPDYYIWAALTPVVALLGRRFPIERGVLLRHASVHLVLSAVFVAGELLASCWVVSLLLVERPPVTLGFWGWYVRVLARFFVWGLLIYWVILAGAHALRWFRQSKEQELAASELEAKLAGAQLRALKMQLHPHFLFNTLHSIGVLVRKNEHSAALEMLTGLGELLRYSLDNADRQEVSLREELEFLERYLEIEQIRFRDRLRVDFDVDPAAYDAAVPNLILQPLVENAIRHGVAPSVKRRTLAIGARRRGDRLVLSVEDDGPGLPDDWRPENAAGVGLTNVRSRLEKLYDRSATLVIDAREGGGVRAVVRLPFRPFVGAPRRRDPEPGAEGGAGLEAPVPAALASAEGGGA